MYAATSVPIHMDCARSLVDALVAHCKRSPDLMEVGCEMFDYDKPFDSARTSIALIKRVQSVLSGPCQITTIDIAATSRTWSVARDVFATLFNHISLFRPTIGGHSVVSCRIFKFSCHSGDVNHPYPIGDLTLEIVTTPMSDQPQDGGMGLW